MKWSQNFLWIGILFIIFGILFLVMGGGGFESGSFFIFPFFFFSTSDPVSILIVLSFAFIILVIMIRSVSGFLGQGNLGYMGEEKEEYLRVGSRCEFCAAPLPANAVFCSRCGNQVNGDRNSNH